MEVRDIVESSDESLYDDDGERVKSVSFSDGVSLGNEIDATTYVECSLATGFGVEQVFFETAVATKKSIPLAIGVKDCTVCHRDSIALKRYNWQHSFLVSQKLFLHHYLPIM